MGILASQINRLVAAKIVSSASISRMMVAGCIVGVGCMRYIMAIFGTVVRVRAVNTVEEPTRTNLLSLDASAGCVLDFDSHEFTCHFH